MAEQIYDGTFITLEGIEGAGKSTHISFIEKCLHNTNREIITTREPGGTEFGEKIREILLNKNNIQITAETELLLMFAARAQHLEEVIRPALQKGATVICDRFTDSSYAYQSGGRGVDHTKICQMAEMFHSDIKPDLTLLLDLPVKEGLSRVSTRGKSDRFESEKVEFFNKVRKAYLKIARAEPERVKLINAAQELNVVQNEIKIILQTLKLC